jgi:acetyltransferase-like isoleucine patch superfamily enzyme
MYLKKHNLFAGIGDNCSWGPWLLPLYPKLIRLHNNVRVHKTAQLITHDVLNRFLSKVDPTIDYGHYEKLGCIELGNNVYISMNVSIMPNVRINDNCIISAGSVVTSDIPKNSIASGIPAKPIGRFDVFMALRRMGSAQTMKFKNQELPDELAEDEWCRFYNRRDEKIEEA